MAIVRVILIITGSSWTVPSDYGTPSTIDCIGSGAAGLPSLDGESPISGGAGAFARANNMALTPGTSVPIQIGGVGFGQDTWFSSATTLLAKGAVSDQGGLAAQCIGNVVYSGGSGQVAAGGGGGAAGPNGPGLNGVGFNGGAGDAGLGGAGGGGPGANGAPGAEYVISAGGTAGAGGGGGGGSSAGSAGVYGGGGGSAVSFGIGMAASGCIIVTYTSTGGGGGGGPHRRVGGGNVSG